MTWSYFFLWSNCCFLSAALCHGAQGHVSDCCIITSSKVGETAAGDRWVQAGASLHFKNPLMIISRIKECIPPLPILKGRDGCPPKMVKKIKCCLFIARDINLYQNMNIFIELNMSCKSGCRVVIDEARATNITSFIYTAEGSKNKIYTSLCFFIQKPIIHLLCMHVCSWLRLGPHHIAAAESRSHSLSGGTGSVITHKIGQNVVVTTAVLPEGHNLWDKKHRYSKPPMRWELRAKRLQQ